VLEGALPLILLISGAILLKLLKGAKNVNLLISEGGALFCGVCFYMAGIFLFLLVGKGEVLSLGLFFSALLMLVVIYISQSALTALFYEVFCGAYLFLSAAPGKRYIFLCMLLFLVPYGIDLYQKKKKRYQIIMFEAATAAVGLLFFYDSPDKAAFGIWVFNLYAYLLVVLLMHYKFYPVKTPYFLSPMKLVGISGIMLLWVFGSQTARWQGGIIPGADWPINIEFFVLLLAVCVLFLENLLRGRVNMEQILFCTGYYLSFAFYIFYEFHSPQRLGNINIYFIALVWIGCVSGMITALKRRDKNLFSLWSGVIMVWFASSLIHNDYLYRAIAVFFVVALVGAVSLHSLRYRRILAENT
jgi:hypothetical protein